MFSKTVMVAGLVATTSAVATRTGLLSLGTVAEYKSNNVACQECLTGNVANMWAYKDTGKTAWYFIGVAVMTTKVRATSSASAQGFCCQGRTTPEAGGGGTTICESAYSSGQTLTSGWSELKVPAANKYNILGLVAACPQYMDVCGAPVLLAGAPAIGSGNRTATLKAKADSVTLPMAVVENNASAKLWQKESCTYVVKSECGAPVITINAATDAAATHYVLYVSEYTTLGLGGAALLGDVTANEFFLPAETTLEIAAGNTNTAALKIGAAEPGNVLFKTGTGTYTRSVPGATLVDWMASITKFYTNHAATKVLFDKAVVDWNSGKRGAKPYVPAQPAAPATILDQLKYSVSAQSVKATIADRGYGNIVQYAISWADVNKEAGAYFGVMQGLSVLQTAAAKSIDPTAAKSMHWSGNAGKTAAGSGATKCDAAYVMVTGIMAQNTQSAAKKFWVDVTEAAWAPTLEESLPAQPAAATAPNATGAGHLTVGAAAAALAALALF